jgi:choline-sulfatase
MKIIYIDVDSLRPDHLGCYGCPRGTSPVIDAFAREAMRFDNVYVSDAPCLPSRTALWSGRFGYRTGVVGHGGTAAQPRIEGPQRGFQDLFHSDGWMTALRRVGHHTVTISSFGERHSAWHWYAGYNEVINPGFQGDDRADQVVPLAIDWIERNADRHSDFFLHVNLWDPHTPYRTPADFGDHFAGASIPAWLTDDVIARQRASFGPMSAQEPNGYAALDLTSQFPRHPNAIRDVADARRWYDGYDSGVRFADFWIGRLFETLRRAGAYDDALIFVSADHGESLGELNVWGDHQTADQFTCHVPLIVRFPRATHAGSVDTGLHYHFDWAATLIEFAGGVVPASWDGRSFADRLGSAPSAGRECLITSQGAWSCQRGARFRDGGKDWLALFTDHAGLKDLDPVMLFDLGSDPYEQLDVAAAEPRVVDRAHGLLDAWKVDMANATGAADPLLTVIEEGGPFHCKGELASYIQRLRQTDRAHHAERLAALDR